MKGYISILKGAKLAKNAKNKNFKSLFMLKKEIKEEKESNNNDGVVNNINYKPKNLKNVIKEPKQMIKLLKRQSRMTTKIYSDYEELFFHFLKNNPKMIDFEIFTINNKINQKADDKKEIDNFEDESDMDFNKENKKIDINKIFYSSIYLGLTKKNQIYWSNFLFPKGIFKIFYKKSKTKQKEILDYSIKYNIEYNILINSYEKKYTIKTKKFNYNLDPETAYINYLEINNKSDEILKKEEIKDKAEIMSLSYNYINRDNIVIKTNNNGKGKILIFCGNKTNIYIDDYSKNSLYNENNTMPIYSNSNENNKEIIYKSRDLLPKIKQSFSFDKTKYLKNKNNFKSNNNNSKNNILLTNCINNTEINLYNRNKSNKKSLKLYLTKLFKNSIFKEHKKVDEYDKLIDKYKFSIKPQFTELDENAVLKKIIINKQNNKNKNKKNIRLFNMFNKFNSDFYY